MARVHLASSCANADGALCTKRQTKRRNSRKNIEKKKEKLTWRLYLYFGSGIGQVSQYEDRPQHHQDQSKIHSHFSVSTFWPCCDVALCVAVIVCQTAHTSILDMMTLSGARAL